MTTFIATFFILGIAILAMAVGVILSNKRIEGSCGSLAAIGIKKACDCDKPCARRRKRDRASRRDVDFRP